MRTILLFVFSILSLSAAAQELIPFQFTSDDDNRLIRENDSFKYYVASGDTTNVVAINEEAFIYRLYNHEKKLIAEGSYIAEGDKYLQDGKWTEYFANGTIKRTGYYKKGIPIGMWEEYHATGRVKVVSNYGIFDEQGTLMSCLSGTYREYYKGGKLKLSGFYAAIITTENDTIMVNDPTTAQEIRKTIQHRKLTPAKVGQWDYYDEAGELEKREEL